MVAEEVAQRGTVDAVEAGACRLRMRVDDLSWPAMMLGAIEADFEVIEPRELSDHLHRIGAHFIAAGPHPVRRR